LGEPELVVRPTATTLPSDWSATPWATALLPMLVKTLPALPKLGSSVPSAL
jgi:hypothetical protein